MDGSRSIFTNQAASSYVVPSRDSALPGQEIIAFHSILPDYAQTPLIPLPTIAKTLKLGNLLIKDERSRFNLPSFKPLGISWAIRNALIEELSETLPEPLPSNISLPDLASKAKEAQIKLIAATDGKLGRIVAKLGKNFGVECINTRIFVAEDLDESVKESIKAEGAEVLSVQGDFDVAVREAWLHSVATDGVLVNIDAEENYEDIPRWIIEGYGTIFRELDAQLETPPDLIVLPVGVGGLAQAAVTHYKSSSGHATRFLTVEPEAAACFYSSLQAAKRVSVEEKETILKHLGYGTVAEAAWEILKSGVDVSTVVSDAEVLQAIEHLKALGVGAGACSGAVLVALEKVFNGELGEFWNLDETSSVVLVCTDGREDA